MEKVLFAYFVDGEECKLSNVFGDTVSFGTQWLRAATYPSWLVILGTIFTGQTTQPTVSSTEGQ